MPTGDHLQSTPDPRSEHPVQTERVVEHASRESFPASDPPSFTPSRAGNATPAVDDVPLVPVDAARNDAREFARTLCDAMDRGDASALASMLTEDAMVRVGTAGLLVGREAAKAWLEPFLQGLGSTSHHITDVRIDGDAVFVESEVNVRGTDGAKEMRPQAISVRMRQGAASRLIVYGT
ncbi:MAG: nuclear transport factor 2 family protein [Gemmatimonadota bacterium]